MQETIHHFLAVWMQFVLDWGYLGVFIMMVFESTAVPIPAEIVIPPAAYWAAQGRFNIAGVIAAATAGAWVGSSISYWIAWKLGRPLVERYGKYVLMSPPKIDAADRWFAMYGAGGIFVARLLPAIRHLISIPAGLFRMNFKTFSVMTILGAAVFHAALAWFGMKTLGSHPELMRDPNGMMEALKANKIWFIGFAVAIALLYWLMTWMQKRAKRTAA